MNAVTETVAAEPVSGVEIFVPLAKLKKSPRNARKVPHGEAAIEALAASIQHRGLIQNLAVEREVKDEKPTGYYFVTAGEGRRLAMLLRAKRKQIKKSEPGALLAGRAGRDRAMPSGATRVVQTATHIRYVYPARRANSSGRLPPGGGLNCLWVDERSARLRRRAG